MPNFSEACLEGLSPNVARRRCAIEAFVFSFKDIYNMLSIAHLKACISLYYTLTRHTYRYTWLLYFTPNGVVQKGKTIYYFANNDVWNKYKVRSITFSFGHGIV